MGKLRLYKQFVNMASRISVSIKKASDLLSMTAKPTIPISNFVKLFSNTQRQFMCTNHVTQILKSEPGYQSKCRVNQKASNVKLVTFRRQGWWTLVTSRNISSCTKEGKTTGNYNSNSPQDEGNDAKLQSGREETIEEHEQSIYKGLLSTQIKLVKSFSLLTSAIGLSCQPILLYQISGNTGNLALAVAGGAFMSFFTFATPLLIHWVAKKYVTELLYNKIDDSYTAITYSLLLREKKVNFKINDVKIPDIPAMFTTIIVGQEKQIPLFVDGAHAFVDQRHYVKLMGYDKPLNLRWDKESDASEGVVESRRRKTRKTKKNL